MHISQRLLNSSKWQIPACLVTESGLPHSIEKKPVLRKSLHSMKSVMPCKVILKCVLQCFKSIPKKQQFSMHKKLSFSPPDLIFLSFQLKPTSDEEHPSPCQPWHRTHLCFQHPCTATAGRYPSLNDLNVQECLVHSQQIWLQHLEIFVKQPVHILNHI